MDHAIEIKKVFHTYSLSRTSVEALKGLDLEVGIGEVFGFIGPNGAGKTTTIKLLLGILLPQRGKLSVFGKDPAFPVARKIIGYMPEIAYYYKHLTPIELLVMYADICGIDRRISRMRANELLEQVGLDKGTDRPISTFSKGMVQKVSFAQALVNDPEILVLDEPTSGLDPVARKRMREIIQKLRRRGKTIFFSSHELSEVELISDRIGVLNKGRLIALGPSESLLGRKEQGQSLENYFLNMIGEA